MSARRAKCLWFRKDMYSLTFHRNNQILRQIDFISVEIAQVIIDAYFSPHHSVPPYAVQFVTFDTIPTTIVDSVLRVVPLFSRALYTLRPRGEAAEVVV